MMPTGFGTSLAGLKVDVKDRRTRSTTSEETARKSIAALSFLGVVDALYMLAYHEGLIGSLACPFFGQGCNVVGRSPHARHFGVPNAAVGALGYATTATLAIWSVSKPPQDRPLQSFGLSAISLAAFVTSVFLTWEQMAKVRAWCFWCLLSAGLSLVILPLALWDGWKSMRSLLQAR